MNNFTLALTSFLIISITFFLIRKYWIININSLPEDWEDYVIMILGAAWILSVIWVLTEL